MRVFELFELLLGFFVEEFTGLEGLADGLAQTVHGVVHVLVGREGILEAGVEQEVGEGLHEVFKIEAGGEVAREFCVASEFHWIRPRPWTLLRLDAKERWRIPARGKSMNRACGWDGY